MSLSFCLPSPSGPKVPGAEWIRRASDPGSDGIAGGFGGVAAAGWRGPAEGTVRKLVDGPFRVLLEPVVVPALRPAITHAGSSTGFVWRVVLEVALGRGPAADRAGAGRVADLGQVPQLDPGVVAAAFVPVLAILGGERVQGDPQVRPVSGDAQYPDAVATGRPG